MSNASKVISLKIEVGHYAVILAEVATGKVVDENGVRQVGENIQYSLFNTLEEAKHYSEKKVLEFPTIECAIFDHLEQRVGVIRHVNYESFLKIDRKAEKKWWKFW